MNLGKKLRRIRQVRGLSAVALAKHARVTPGFISQLEYSQLINLRKLALTSHSCHQPPNHPPGEDWQQCQIESSILRGRKRHKINAQHSHHMVPDRLKPIWHR